MMHWEYREHGVEILVGEKGWIGRNPTGRVVEVYWDFDGDEEGGDYVTITPYGEDVVVSWGCLADYREQEDMPYEKYKLIFRAEAKPEIDLAAMAKAELLRQVIVLMSPKKEGMEFRPLRFAHEEVEGWPGISVFQHPAVWESYAVFMEPELRIQVGKDVTIKWEGPDDPELLKTEHGWQYWGDFMPNKAYLLRISCPEAWDCWCYVCYLPHLKPQAAQAAEGEKPVEENV